MRKEGDLDVKQRPLVVACCCWVLGSVLASMNTGMSFWMIWAGVSLILPFGAILAKLSWQRTLLLWIIFTGAAQYWNYNEMRNVSTVSSVLDSHAVSADQVVIYQASGIIVSDPKTDGDRTDFRIKLDNFLVDSPGQKRYKADLLGETMIAQIRLVSEEELHKSAAWKRGQKVILRSGTLLEPSGARNYGGFDYQEYLHHERIHWLLKIKGAANVQIVSNPQGAVALLAWNDRLRSDLAARIGQLFGTRDAGFMKGLLIGITDELDPETYSHFSQLGLTHILAISGSHVAINIGILFWLLRRFRVSKDKALLASIMFIPFYVLITGFTPSVIRSGVMSMLGLYLLRKGLFKDSLNILSAAALLMLVWEPYYLYNVSFQLSFIVTAGLIVLVPLLLPHLSLLPKKIQAAAAMTIVAQLVSFPLTLYYFNQFSLLSLAANFIIVPLIGVVSLSAGTAALLISFVWEPLGSWIAYPVEIVNRITFATAAWLNERSGFMTIWKSPAIWWMIAYYILIFAEFYLGRIIEGNSTAAPLAEDETQPLTPEMSPLYRQSELVSDRIRLFPVLQVVCCIALIGLLVLGYQPDNPAHTGRVQFIDVGQGDCTLITTPEGRNILVDGGGTVSFGKPKEAWRNKREPYEVGQKVVVPLLKKRGIHKLDAIILTHADQDHIGGLQAVVESIPVEAIMMNGSLADSKTMKDLIRTSLLKQIKIYSLYGGMQIKPDERTTFTFLSPSNPVMDREGQVPFIKEQNHVSIAFLMDMDNTRFLFTGDMDEAAERDVMDKLGPQQNAAALNVLKVAHHGSHTSTSEAWLNYWKPAAAVISVGASNTYGHPHADILSRLAAEGSEVHRTDEMGEIQFQVKNGAVVTRHLLSPRD